MFTRRILPLIATLAAFRPTAAQDFKKWCGKFYEYGAPMSTSLTYTYPYPDVSATPLLDLQCTTKSSFYLTGDDEFDPPAIIIDANVTNDIGSAYYGSSGNLTVVISLNGSVLGSGSVAPGTLGNVIPMSLANVTASNTAYKLTCAAQAGNQTFTTHGDLSYRVPPPWGGCGAKIDRMSGSTMVRNATAGEIQWKKIIPVGFYDEIGQNSTTNPTLLPLDRLHQAHEYGMNIVHVRPAFPAVDVFNAYLDTLDSLGMHFVLDMSDRFTNLTAAEELVERVKNRTNLIGWYTGDEPDGSDYGSNTTMLAYQKIYELDGYRPVSVTLNCENYKFTEYGLNGADQIGVDPYPINLNGAFSRVYGTPCDKYFGVSGCDSCEGSIYDITSRIDSAINRARLAGKYRTKQVWSVPQAFDDQAATFWTAGPTGSDLAVQMVVALNHGAAGVTPFDAPGAPLTAFTNASLIAQMVTDYDYFFTEHAETRSAVNTTLPYPGLNNLDVASWTANVANGTVALVAAANFFLKEQTFNLTDVSGTIVNVLFGNVTQAEGITTFVMPGNSVAAVFMQK